jgi:hypothetical protein
MSVSVRDFLGFVVNPPPGDPSRTAASDLLGPTVATYPKGSANVIPEILVAPPSGDATGATDAAAIQNALTALNALGGHGIIQFGLGTYYTNQPIDVHGTTGITLQGVGGLTAGASGASNLLYVGTGAGSFVNAQGTAGFRLRDLLISASSASFTGTLIDISATPSSLCSIEDSYLGMTATNVGVVINLDQCNHGKIINCNIVGGQYGVQGVAVAGHTSNAHTISENRIGGQGAACMIGVHGGWKITGNTFELQAGIAAVAPPAVAVGAGAGGVEFSGNWIGDSPASGQTIITAGHAWMIVGNFIGGANNTTGIAILPNTNGTVIKANRFDTHALGIALASSNIDVDYTPNYYNTVATRFTAPTATPGVGLGTGATATLAAQCSDYQGSLTLVSGSGTAAGVLASITLPSAHQQLRPVITPSNSAAATLQTFVIATATSAFDIRSANQPSGPGTNFVYNWTLIPTP